MANGGDIVLGARNLLLNCAEIVPGERVRIVCEHPDCGWYDADLCEAILREARHLGIEPEVVIVGPPGRGDADPVADTLHRYDCTIFLARIGDRDRFADPVPGHRAVMVYARDAAMLASRYGSTDHRALVALRDAVDTVMASARRIEISCPLGTAVTGTPAPCAARPVDVSVRRFPMGVPAPVRASQFSGRVALARYLTPTGSQAYAPNCIRLDRTVFAILEAGRIQYFEGLEQDVECVERHYDFVADTFGIDRNAVHSWHAGIHPGCGYAGTIDADPDRWSNTIFTSPRCLHFHTCGDYAPGEICWMVLDPDVVVDGVPLWSEGRLRAEAFEATAACVARWNALAPLIEAPDTAIGV